MQKVVFEVIGMGAKKYGGFEKYILEEAKQLEVKGYKLIIIFDTPPLADKYVQDLLKYGVTIYTIPYSKKGFFIKSFLKLINEYHPQIVHTNFSSNVFVVQFISFITNIPKRIATEHCLPIFNTFLSRIKVTLFSTFVHKILPVSKESTISIRKGLFFNKNKVRTLYLGVNDFHFDYVKMREKYQLPKNQILIMNIAYHNPVKGVDVLLHAFAILIHQYKLKNIVLCQIGGGQTGNDTTALKKLANELNINNNIIWMGIQNNVPEILSAGDIYCQPSRSEGIPLSLMEASLAQLPIVATNVGGNSEAAIHNENAILVKSEDYENMAAALRQFITNSDMRISYGKRGREIALNNFCIEQQVSKLINSIYFE